MVKCEKSSQSCTQAPEKSFHPRIVASLVFVFLLAVALLSAAYCDSLHPWAMIGFPAAVGGLIAYSIAIAFAVRARFVLRLVDVVRASVWGVFGAGEGAREMANAYFGHFWPSHAGMVSLVAVVAMLLAVILAVTLTFLYPKRLPRKGCCAHCEYSLTGNLSGICPECGTRLNA